MFWPMQQGKPALIDRELYLPKSWIADRDRCPTPVSTPNASAIRASIETTVERFVDCIRRYGLVKVFRLATAAR